MFGFMNEYLAFIVNFYIIVVGMYFVEYIKLNLVQKDRIFALLNVLPRTDVIRWFVTQLSTTKEHIKHQTMQAMHTRPGKPCMPEHIGIFLCHDSTSFMSK